MKELVEVIAKALVDHPEEMTVTETKDGDSILIELKVAPEDMGKVIGEFVCDKVYLIKNQGSRFSVADEEQSVTNEIARQSCLDYDDMVSYLGNKDGYGLHITDLKIYDKPKELSEFCIPCKVSCENCKNPLYFECWCEEKGKKIVTRPPQSYMFVEEVEQ